MFGGATLVSAQVDQTTPSSSQTQSQDRDQDQDRQQISVSELPDAVTAKLEGQDYSGWTVGNAYKKMDDSNQEMYIIELRQGTETKKVKFDRDGNELEKGKHGDKAGNSNYRDDASQSDQSIESDQSAQDQSTQSDESTTDESVDQADNTQTEQQ